VVLIERENIARNRKLNRLGRHCFTYARPTDGEVATSDASDPGEGPPGPASILGDAEMTDPETTKQKNAQNIDQTYF